jgi:hypothetical protein
MLRYRIGGTPPTSGGGPLPVEQRQVIHRVARSIVHSGSVKQAGRVSLQEAAAGSRAAAEPHREPGKNDSQAMTLHKNSTVTIRIGVAKG